MRIAFALGLMAMAAFLGSAAGQVVFQLLFAGHAK
jgi:hypothetical protein